MDALDLRILECLDRNARGSYSEVAKELNVTPRSVQRRVSRMAQSGFIRSFEAVLETSAAGLAEATCDVYVQSDAPITEVRKRLLEIPGLDQILTLVGGTLVSYIHYGTREELEDTLTQVGNTPGVADIHYELGPQSNTGNWSLSKSDWRIINALNHRARKEAVEISKHVGLSSKTIRSRINELIKRRAVKFGVDVNLSKAKDLFLYMLVVRLKQGTSKDQTTTRIRKNVPTIWREIRCINPFVVIFSLFAERLADLERDVEAVRQDPEMVRQPSVK